MQELCSSYENEDVHTEHVTALALPDESPEAVLALARRFDARLLIVADDDVGRQWPAILQTGGNAAACFQKVDLTDIDGKSLPDGSPLSQIRVFRIACP
jgi:hypothetical protein